MLSPGQSGPLSQAILVPHHYCGEPPHTHSLRSSSQLDTHKDTRAQAPESSEYINPTTHRAASWQLFIGRGSCLQLHQLCQPASSSVFTLFWDFSLSQLNWFNEEITLYTSQLSIILSNNVYSSFKKSTI